MSILQMRNLTFSKKANHFYDFHYIFFIAKTKFSVEIEVKIFPVIGTEETKFIIYLLENLNICGHQNYTNIQETLIYLYD